MAALEFALVAPVFFLVLLGGIELGLLWWTKNTLQMIAAVTARCVAVNSTSCTDPASFARSMAASWVVSDAVSDVTATRTTSCYTSGGNTYARVTITCRLWDGSLLPPLFSNVTFSVTGCYPMVS